MKTLNERILKKIAQKYNLNLSITKIITSFAFKKVQELQRTNSTECIHLKGFGKFYVKPGKRFKVQQTRDIKKKALLAKEMNKIQQLDI